jgi:hypothetical protein
MLTNFYESDRDKKKTWEGKLFSKRKTRELNNQKQMQHLRENVQCRDEPDGNMVKTGV